ncbi:MAG TPA: LCP family protein, partial [Candidatus Saccharimonadales bacterium]|nr:LCP family protein [Candidatus Saccharimonadales bacterium]
IEAGRALGRSDIDESLREIDETEEKVTKPSRRQKRRQRKDTHHPSRVRRTFKWFGVALLVIILAVAGFAAYKFISAGHNIFQGNIFDILQSQPLKQDANGRSNILIFGTSEDDPGHSGANLTDSLMVLSIDQNSKDAFMLSIPRDLYVDYGGACSEGYQGKINSMYDCYSGNGEDENAGSGALKEKIGEITGLDIQYYVHVNYTVLKEAVDAVGGIDVTIESSDPRGILDRNFDWKCGYRCHYVNYENGERAHMDGEHALAFARARNAAGGYGLSAGNFDREKNQQKVITALQQKAISVGTLTNLSAVTSLLDTFGRNLRTNFETKEIQTLVTLGTEVKGDRITSLSLVEEDNSLVTTGMIGASSVVRPIAGLYDYSEIQAYIKKNLSSNPVVREAAPIVILNGTGQAGLGQTKTDILTERGFTIVETGNAPEGTYDKVEIYHIGTGNTGTATELAKLYNVTLKKTAPPVAVNGNVAFVIIYGEATD